MRSFASDNNSGVHPEVMAAIIEANRDHAAAFAWVSTASVAYIPHKQGYFVAFFKFIVRLFK